jgi:calcineurin-like phosphoesterase family protein
VLRFDNRPYSTVEEMHVDLIKNWNSIIKDDDIVYYLGDLSMGNKNVTNWFINSLKGKIHFILGNHDKMRDIIKLNRWEQVYEYGTEINVKDDDIKNARGIGYQRIIMSHYPILSWNKSHYGSWHIHGHCHGSLMKEFPEYYERKVIDVGCNVIGYKPLSYTETKIIMSNKIIKGVDHHVK